MIEVEILNNCSVLVGLSIVVYIRECLYKQYLFGDFFQPDYA